MLNFLILCKCFGKCLYLENLKTYLEMLERFGGHFEFSSFLQILQNFHRVNLQSSHPNCQKKICHTQNGQHFEFLQKLQNTKMLSRKPCLIERFVCRVSLQSSHPSFQKIFVLPNFEFFAKIAKHKNAYISKTVLDRAISTRFLNRRVSLQSSHPNFQKSFVSPF